MTTLETKEVNKRKREKGKRKERERERKTRGVEKQFVQAAANNTTS